jgi:hypothetical protein
MKHNEKKNTFIIDFTLLSSIYDSVENNDIVCLYRIVHEIKSVYIFLCDNIMLYKVISVQHSAMNPTPYDHIMK